MPERQNPPTVAQRLKAAEAAIPGALELAALLPQAARIEPRLLRALRLGVAPHCTAADEADLWSSDLVERRALDGLVLRADVQESMRRRARSALRHAGPHATSQDLADRLHRANGLLRQHHAHLPPLVQMEEEIAWLAMAEATPEAMIRQKLEMALAALVRDGRVGVARWAVRALPRLPEAARATATAFQLAQAARDRLPAGAQMAPLKPPAGMRLVDLAALAPNLGRTPLGVRRIGDRLELGAVGPGGLALMVPASEPRYVALQSNGLPKGLECAVPKGERVETGVGWEPVIVQAADGQRWVLPDQSEQERRWLERATVALMANQRRRVLATLIAPSQAVVPAAPLGRGEAAIEGPDGKPLPVLMLGQQGAGSDRLKHVVLPRELSSGEPLPQADAVADDAKVLSLGLNRDGTSHPVVGRWINDPKGALVLARTRAEPEGCVGAPVVVDGQLAGMVTRASIARSPRESGSGDTRNLRLQVTRQLQPLDTRPQGAGAAAITVELLPAGNGAAILIGWGPPEERRHLLLDGGPRRTAKAVIARVQQAIGPSGRLALLVVSHTDADRIEGAGELLAAGVPVDDVWFNGPVRFGLSGAVPSRAAGHFEERLAKRSDIRANAAFRGGPILVQPSGPLPRVELPGGASLTLLGPDPRSLERAASAWQRTAASRGVEPEGVPAEEVSSVAPTSRKALAKVRSFGGDSNVNNGASLMLLFEYQGRSVLLPGDAHAAPLAAAVRRLADERGRAGAGLYVDVFVLPHAGSRGNVTPELFDVLEAGVYAVSTDGSIFHHPDPETIELIARRRPGSTLVFNYRSETSMRWADARFQKQHQLRVVLPEGLDGGMELKVGELAEGGPQNPYK